MASRESYLNMLPTGIRIPLRKLYDSDASLMAYLTLDRAATYNINITGAFTEALRINADGTTAIHVTTEFSGADMIVLAGSATDNGIEISGTCTEAAIDIQGTQTAAGLLISGTTADGISISGLASAAAINITAQQLVGLKSVWTTTAQLGQYVQGIKIEHTRSGNTQPATGGWWGAQIVLNAGTGTQLNKPCYVIHGVMKGSAGNQSEGNVARFETQSSGAVEDLLFVSANSGSTVAGDIARFVAHAAPNRAILALQNGTVGSTPMALCIDIDETMTTGIQFNSGAALTNCIQVTNAANCSYFILADAEAGCFPNYSSTGSAIANIKIKIGSADGYIKVYDAA